MLLFNWRVYQSGGALTVVGTDEAGIEHKVRMVESIIPSKREVRRTVWGFERVTWVPCALATVRGGDMVVELAL